MTKDGRLTFDATTFKGALASNPTLVQNILGGSTGTGADGNPGTADDTIATDGLAARFAVLAGQASDSTTGLLTTLATGQDSTAKDVQSQIDDWTVGLQLRQQTLTAQFTAMETALGSLKNQSSWLTSQISSLPTCATTK